jgi:ubiquinone/menaquinone biosynthesis C-methylase UbiE
MMIPMDYYDSIAEGYEELHREEQIKKIKLILPFLKKITDENKKTKILDVGCGSGILFEFIKGEKTGIDPSKKLIKIAEKKKNGKYSFGKAEKLAFKDNEFDLVVSMTAIQNFSDIKKGISEIRRVGRKKFLLTFLKKSGKRKEIESQIKKKFIIEKKIEEEKDLIFMCSVRN